MAAVDIITSETFDRWLRELRDPQARARIRARLRRLSLGNAGHVAPIGGGLSEMKIDYGPGYRVYFLRQGIGVAVVLCGGDKHTQSRDITKAHQLAAIWRE